jgi:hypothetical protein
MVTLGERTRRHMLHSHAPLTVGELLCVVNVSCKRSIDGDSVQGHYLVFAPRLLNSWSRAA